MEQLSSSVHLTHYDPSMTFSYMTYMTRVTNWNSFVVVGCAGSVVVICLLVLVNQNWIFGIYFNIVASAGDVPDLPHRHRLRGDLRGIRHRIVRHRVLFAGAAPPEHVPGYSANGTSATLDNARRYLCE